MARKYLLPEQVHKMGFRFIAVASGSHIMHGSFVTGRACLGWSDYFHRHCDVILHACTAHEMLQWSKISIMSSSFYPTNIKRFHYKGRGSISF